VGGGGGKKCAPDSLPDIEGEKKGQSLKGVKPVLNSTSSWERCIPKRSRKTNGDKDSSPNKRKKSKRIEKNHKKRGDITKGSLEY